MTVRGSPSSMARSSSGLRNWRQSWVPAGTQRSTYSAANLPSSRPFKVRFRVATIIIPPGLISLEQARTKASGSATCSITSMVRTTSKGPAFAATICSTVAAR